MNKKILVAVMAVALVLPFGAALATAPPAAAGHYSISRCAHYDGWSHRYDGAYHVWVFQDFIRSETYGWNHRHLVKRTYYDGNMRYLSHSYKWEDYC